jgi:hypothetical protein
MRIAVTSISLLIGLSACRGLHPGKPEAPQMFDEGTGNTMSVVSKPMVFARERTDVAAFARDYATLVAVEIDHSGEFANYLLLYRWSTVDRRMSPPPNPESGELRILAEGRVLDLRPLDAMPISFTRGALLHVPLHGDTVTHAYRVDTDALRFIATSGDLALRLPQEPFDTPFRMWEDGRAALREFLRRTADP